jgi:DNA-binding transcriptional ArsR family regulator
MQLLLLSPSYFVAPFRFSSWFGFCMLLYLKILSSGKDNNSAINPYGSGYIDPRFKRVLWYLICSTRGGVNRAKILEMLSSKPANAHQIAKELNLDYKTVLHHLKVLTNNGLVITDKENSYGAAYFLTPIMENNYQSFIEILSRIKSSHEDEFGKK